jgi:hypothetical protein
VAFVILIAFLDATGNAYGLSLWGELTKTVKKSFAHGVSIGTGQGFRVRLGICRSGLGSGASDSGLGGTSIEPTVSTQSKRGWSDKYDGRSGKGIEIELSAAISSCEGKDG